ncbi:alpha-xenorhabdolysin family binary toxin subunit A [Pseudomonas sp. BGI-2]|uniref:alpha-xenorhabdolysin family binary toxin subunit A n=1 Tax=Pseudomonas sp. BGI-2 TaxID=2528211 RepID=UPI0010335376|nr:alpha-xenorhabdolysin family binary toxin subunit A [Pseudomonas sp. BGI-2]TBN34983.1 hypothetical protein EYC95_26540 [Pseudomonas sp. BGI-2]
MEFKTSSKLLEVAAKAPMIFVDASLGRGEFDGEEYNRETGIQLTKEQIISLRKYEELGLSFPVQLQDVIAYLKYGADDNGSVGLAAEDFLRTFTITNIHARRWRPLRQDIMQTGNQLKIFSGSIIGIGGEIVSIYNELKSSGYLEEYNITTPEQYLELKKQFPDLPDLDLPSGDVPDIKYFLNQILDKVKDCHAKAEEVREGLDSFGTDMREQVLPEIKLRLKFVSENTYQADIQVLQDEIEARSKEIDLLNERYSKLVKDAIISGATMNIGGLVLGIYYGVKAEEVRRERNALRALQNEANLRMASKSQTLSSLNKVRDDLQNLTYVAIEAELATQNLMLVWNALSDWISSSAEHIDKVDNAISLRTFINEIKRVVGPWEEIQKSSDELLKVFKAADDEYESSCLIFQDGNAMTSTLHHLGSGFDMAQLRSHNDDVQGANTDVQMLFQQFDYLPGPVETLSTLAVTINRTVFDVRVQAQSSEIKLASSLRSLKDYLTELGNPADDDEIREDMERELQGVSGHLSAKAEIFQEIERSVSGRFDRAVSKQWVVALQQDLVYAEQQKTRSDEKVSELKEQMTSVLEAIELIEKAGIEKIGEESQLTLDKLKTLGLAPPQIEIALLALETLKKLIAGIGHAISYLNMIAAYNSLKQRALELKSQSDGYAKDIVKTNGKIRLVYALDTLDDGRWAFGNEFSKLVVDFEQFAQETKQDKGLPVEERADIAIARIADVVECLKTIQR